MKVRIPISRLALPRSRYVCRTSCLAARHFSITRTLGRAEEALRFPGALEAKFTTELKFDHPKDRDVISCYRVMDTEGIIVDKSYKIDLSDEEALKMYTNMVGISILDVICLDAQRQGKAFSDESKLF